MCSSSSRHFWRCYRLGDDKDFTVSLITCSLVKLPHSQIFSPSNIQVKFSLLYEKHLTSCPAPVDEEKASWSLLPCHLCYLNASHKPVSSGKPFFLPRKINNKIIFFFSESITGYKNKTNSTVMVNLILGYLVFNKSSNHVNSCTNENIYNYIVSSLVSSSGI